MTTQHSKKLLGNTATAVHFDDRTALHLTQAFNQEEHLDSLLALLMSQLQALCHTQGLRYQHPQLDVDLQLGRAGLHHADYNLEANNRDLGNLTLYFGRTRNEAEVQTCEDLLALVFTALRNRVEMALIESSRAYAKSHQTVGAREPEALGKEEKADTLVLVALDSYTDMVARDGDEWSQILMSSVHTQIKEGLRGADGVYQIADDSIAVLLPQTSMSQAQEVAEKIRVLIASLHLSGEGITQQLTACMGISDARLASTAEDVMAHAKTALAQAKDAGTNNVVTYDKALMLKLGIG